MQVVEHIFTPSERERVVERILLLVSQDARITAAATVGSMALAQGDRWSDVDLTFAVREQGDVLPVLDAFTNTLEVEFEAVPLFDLPSDGVLYRVLLLRGALQVDLSAAPETRFGPRGPKFRLLFGQSVDQPTPGPAAPSPGYAVHHALRTRFCIERGRLLQADYWLAAARHIALAMACARLGLDPAYGRGFHHLPPDTQALAARSLVRSLDPVLLLETLDGLIALLIEELSHSEAKHPLLEQRLRLLTQPRLVDGQGQ